MNTDEDGFSVAEAPVMVPTPPVQVEVPSFFAGCSNSIESTIKCMNELSKPFSIEFDGWDTGYRRLANALIQVLANQKGISP